MKPLYFVLTTLLTSTGEEGSCTPITPLPPPNAPAVLIPERPAKLLTSSPDFPILMSSRLLLCPKEFSGYEVIAPIVVREQPPVTVDAVPDNGPIKYGVALKVTAEPCVAMPTAP